MSVNKVILIGNVGQDPRVKYFDTGSAVATFPLATTDRGYTLANGTQIPERTEWHNIVASNRLAEIVDKYVHKGDKLYLEGKEEPVHIVISRALCVISLRFLWTIWKCCLRKGLIQVRELLNHLQHRLSSRSRCNSRNSRNNRRSRHRHSRYKIIRQMTCRFRYCDNVSIG